MAVRDLFGPVTGPEVIAGRAYADNEERVWLLAGERTLVSIDIGRATFAKHPVRVPDTVACWGLARLRDGTLWTLKGWRDVAQVSESGEIARELRLDAPHFGLFGEGDRLLYQPAEFDAPAPVLFAAAPGDTARTPWSRLESRPFKFSRASAAALNMITCGVGRRGERPCWFPDEAAVALIDASGATRRVTLPGLDVVSPEVLLTVDNPPRPVRDAYVDPNGTIWILGSGPPSGPVDDRPGGRILARYDHDGRPIASQPLPEPARLILQARQDRAVLLMGSGMVSEVRP